MTSFLFLPPSLFPVYDHAADIALRLCDETILSLVHLNHLRFNVAHPNLVSQIYRFEAYFRYRSFISHLPDHLIHYYPKLCYPDVFNYRQDLKYQAIESAIQTVSSHFKDTSLNPFGKHSKIVYNSFLDYLSVYAFCEQYLSSAVQVFIYNTRLASYRAVYDFCLEQNVSFVSYEYPTHGKKRYLFFPNAAIHDFPARSKHISNIIQNHPLSLSKKISFGKRWLNKRLTGRNGFELNFSSAQYDTDIDSHLPKNIKSKKVILCINSSEWEWSALPQSQPYSFGSQLKALEWLVSDYLSRNKNLHLVIRFHPQYAIKDKGYYRSISRHLLSLNSSQLTIIPPSSPVDTKQLAISSSVVFSFYSSLAPELSSIGLPVISLGPTSFENLSCTHIATDVFKLEKLLDSALYNCSLPKLLSDQSYLFYFGRSFQGIKPKYLFYDDLMVPRLSKKFGGKRLYEPHHIIVMLRFLRIFLTALITGRLFNIASYARIRSPFSYNI